MDWKFMDEIPCLQNINSWKWDDSSSGILSEVLSSAEGFFDPRARWTRRGSKILTSWFLLFPEMISNYQLGFDRMFFSGSSKLLTWPRRCSSCRTCSRASRGSHMSSTWTTIDNQRSRSYFFRLCKTLSLRVGSIPIPCPKVVQYLP